MPGPIIKTRPIDAANLASKLPEPLQQPGGMGLQLLMDAIGAEVGCELQQRIQGASVVEGDLVAAPPLVAKVQVERRDESLRCGHAIILSWRDGGVNRLLLRTKVAALPQDVLDHS